ncbi:MAG: tripartite tricarboxylate transporter permease [Acidovorax sp.]|uniref:tripartite tricarboxylate transporter permease n=1 Tax=Acidovorax sp. TaxID=1872122 RepID=UPI00391DBFBD
MNWADIAFRFGPAEYVAILTLLLLVACVAAPQPLTRSSGMAVMGLLLGTQGLDGFGDPRHLPGLELLQEDPMVLVSCVALFALVVPQIARHAMPRIPATSRRMAIWNTVYQCLGFWPASAALIATAGWSQRPAWTGPFAAAWCGGLMAWYGLTPELWGVCAVAAAAGLVFMQLGCAVVPLLVGMLASPLLEQNLRRALLLSRGEWAPGLLHRPIVAGLILAGVLVLVLRAYLLERSQTSRVAANPVRG